MNNLYQNKQINHNIRIEFPQLKDKTEATQWSAQMTQLPQFTLNAQQYANGPWMMSNIPAASVQFEPLNVTFLLDEDWQVYQELYQWMLGEGDYIKGNQNEVDCQPRDMLVHVMDNKNEKIKLTFKFHQAFPTVLNSVDFDLADESATYNKLPVIFAYKWFTIEKTDTLYKMKFKK